MTTTVVRFWRLRSGIALTDYEAFLRDMKPPAPPEVSCVTSKEVVRVQGPARGEEELPFDILEITETTDLEGYRRALQENPVLRKFENATRHYVESVGDLWGVKIAEEPAEPSLRAQKIPDA